MIFIDSFELMKQLAGAQIEATHIEYIQQEFTSLCSALWSFESDSDYNIVVK